MWWADSQNLTQGVPLQDPTVYPQTDADAFTKGLGAHWADQMVQGIWSLQEAKLHINVLEMRAVRLAFQIFSFPVASSVLVASDNTTVVAYII